ncbi:MAG TPA: tetratricopeptide repeat protein, partial [Phototrophicaceae bacterium]|nr:tetratricopeptide repeat protein [Phototrophicaceae bacterium]
MSALPITLPSPLPPDDLLIEQLGRQIATCVFNMPLDAFPAWCAIQPEDTMIAVVEWLKAKAQQAWGRPLEESEALAKTIIDIGQRVGSRSIEALGTMALGDGQKIRGDRQELARENLNRAGELYLQAGSRVGWGRTRIGLLHLSLNLNKDAALADAYEAARIFKDEGTPLFLLRLNNAIGQLFDRVGESDKALLHYQEALDIALEIKAESELSNLYNNLGVCELELGNLKVAFNHFENAQERFLKQDQPVYAAIARHNMGIIHMFRGNYRKSIQEMQEALNVIDGASHYFQSVKSRCDLAVAYLELNRYEEAETVLEQGRQWFESSQSPYYAGRILIYLALVQAYLQRFDDAHIALDQAETLLNLVFAEKHLLELDTMRARVALLQEDFERAWNIATQTAAEYREMGKMLSYVRALLLTGQALLQKGDYDAVLTASQKVLGIAPALHLLQEDYDAHLLAAQALEKQHAFDQARVEYAAAARQLNQVYHSLTVALRANYLATKQNGLRGWIRVAVLQGEIEEALNALEQSRGQLWLRYLREDRWIETPQTEPLLRHLEWLRSQYHWLSEQEKDRAALLACENEIHAVIEQLQNYIHGSDVE